MGMPMYRVTVVDETTKYTEEHDEQCSRPGLAVDRALSKVLRRGGYGTQIPRDGRVLTVAIRRVW